jgi:hypothetical protein
MSLRARALATLCSPSLGRPPSQQMLPLCARGHAHATRMHIHSPVLSVSAHTTTPAIHRRRSEVLSESCRHAAGMVIHTQKYAPVPSSNSTQEQSGFPCTAVMKKLSPSRTGKPLSQSAVTTAVTEQHWANQAVRMCTAALMCAEIHSAPQHTADTAPGAKHTDQRTLGRHTRKPQTAQVTEKAVTACWSD